MEKQLSYLNQLDIQRIQEENDSMTVKRKNPKFRSILV